MLMCEELARTALRARQEHAIDAVHFAIEGQACLPHDVQSLPACILTSAITDIDERPPSVEQLRRCGVRYDRRQASCGQGPYGRYQFAMIDGSRRAPGSAVVHP